MLADPVFGPYIGGLLLSTAGVWIYNISAAILAFELTRSPWVVGLVSIAQFTPQLLLAGVTGSLADRGDRKRQIVAGRLVVAAGAGGLACWLWVGGPQSMHGAWPVITAAAVVGVGFVIGGPAMNSVVPNLVRPEEIPAAIGLNNVPITIARALGPALGALVAATAGFATAFTLAALGNIAFALTVVLLTMPRRSVQRVGADRSMRAGLRHVRADPTLIRLLVGIAAVAVGADPAITLAPALSDQLVGSTELVGVLASAFGVGAVLAMPLLEPLRRWRGERWLSTASLVTLAIGLLSLTATNLPWIAVAGFVLGGVGMMAGLTSLSTQIQLRLPDEVRGRVMALWAIGFLGSRPPAAALDGAVAQWVSVEAALSVIALIVLVAAWVSRPRRIAPSRFGPGRIRPSAAERDALLEAPEDLP